MADLKTDYVNDVLDTDVNNERTYNLVDANGNLIYEGIKIRETTVLSTTGDNYGALQINEQNTKINQINNDLTNIEEEISRDVTVEKRITITLPYTAPSDGYLYVKPEPNAWAAISANNQIIGGTLRRADGSAVEGATIFAKKGITYNTPSKSGTIYVYFTPLV